nr:MAG TPA: hypothetical protein [Microviridae sp.]
MLIEVSFVLVPQFLCMEIIKSLGFMMMWLQFCELLPSYERSVPG